MKRIKSLILPTLLLASLSLTGCPNNDNGISWKSGDKVFYDKILFDTSEENPDNPHIFLGVDGSVQSVKLGREQLEFGYRGKVLTISADGLKKVGPGEKNAVVTFDSGKKVTVPVFNATKLIKTADEFQAIGNSKKDCEGYYALANDIDCSGISNFEPIGQYFSEEDPTNFYFHGVLEGNGYAIKNVNASYSDSRKGISDQNYPSNYDVYSGNAKFSNPAHQAGDNIGIFQVIGSSGVVRNVVFDNCKVHGRTIVGVIAGNVMGRVENVLIKANCQVKMDTHFYDDDCNAGAAFGIVAGSGNVDHIISLTSDITLLDIYEDYDDVYVGKTGNDWDHSATAGNTDPWWRFAGASKEIPDDPAKAKITDSNNQRSNGVYSVAGKVWGQVTNSVGNKFRVLPYGQGETPFDAAFSHTHQAINKPTSGDSDLGMIENCAVYNTNTLKLASTYSTYGFDSDVWNIVDGSFPSIKANVYRFDIAK